VLGAPPLSPVESRLLMQLAQRRHVAAGAVVLDRQRTATDLVLLLSGDVVLGTRNEDGTLQAERSLSAPAWLDVSAAWLGQPYAMDAQALNDVVVAELPLAELRQQLVRQPMLADRLIVTLARRVHELTAASRRLMRLDAPARLAAWLLQRCPANDDAPVLKLQERKRDVASQLAMTPETLSRLLRTFEERGVIAVQGYTLIVQDLAALRTLATPS
jgi:CRP-like cAMP-binding protein